MIFILSLFGLSKAMLCSTYVDYNDDDDNGNDDDSTIQTTESTPNTLLKLKSI